jgi:endonuclease/exonuclease/phosphatase family metal-dependent hydrolase
MDDPDKRLAEAQHTRAIADAIVAANPEAGVIILGDFNDTPGSPPYDATVGSAPDAYYDVTVDLAAGERWSYDFMGTLELVDQQMANPLMADRLNPASVRILHGPEVESASDHSPIVATYDVN